MATTPITRASLIARLSDADDIEAWQEFVEIYLPLLYRLAQQRLAARRRGRVRAGGANRCIPSRSSLATRSSTRTLSRLAVSNCSKFNRQLSNTTEARANRYEKHRRRPAARGPDGHAGKRYGVARCRISPRSVSLGGGQSSTHRNCHHLDGVLAKQRGNSANCHCRARAGNECRKRVHRAQSSDGKARQAAKHFEHHHGPGRSASAPEYSQ